MSPGVAAAPPAYQAPVIRRPSPRNPGQKKTRVEVKSVRLGAETLVLCRSEGRIAKDRAIGEKQEGRLAADVERLRIAKGQLVRPVKIGAAIGRLKERYPRGYWRLDYHPESQRFHADVDRDKRTKAEKLDGCYILKSDRHDLREDELWRIYGLLRRVENAFRNMKSPLGLAPHLPPAREAGGHPHFPLRAGLSPPCRHRKDTPRPGRPYFLASWASLREQLRTHQVCTVALPTAAGAVLRIRKAGTPEPGHIELYKLLDIQAPVMAEKRTWSETPKSD